MTPQFYACPQSTIDDLAAIVRERGIEHVRMKRSYKPICPVYILARGRSELGLFLLQMEHGTYFFLSQTPLSRWRDPRLLPDTEELLLARGASRVDVSELH